MWFPRLVRTCSYVLVLYPCLLPLYTPYSCRVSSVSTYAKRLWACPSWSRRFFTILPVFLAGFLDQPPDNLTARLSFDRPFRIFGTFGVATQLPTSQVSLITLNNSSSTLRTDCRTSVNIVTSAGLTGSTRFQAPFFRHCRRPVSSRHSSFIIRSTLDHLFSTLRTDCRTSVKFVTIAGISGSIPISRAILFNRCCRPAILRS